MAGRTWFKLIRNALLAAAVLTAAQVGAASSLFIDWEHSFVDPQSWGQLLTWVALFYAVGTVGGAAVGQRFVPKRLKPLRSGRRAIAIRMFASVAAGCGAAATLPLVWLPVRVGQPTLDPRAELTITLTAVAGILVGIILALAALTWGPVLASVIASAGWVWLFALGSAGLAAANHARVWPRLGLLDAPQLIPASAWWFGPYLMVGVAALVGLMVAAGAAWRGARWHGIALSGFAGPVLVASTYLITGWGVSGHGEDVAPYAASLVAAAVGLVVSAAVAAPQRKHAPLLQPAELPPAPAGGPALPAARPLAISSRPSTYVVEGSGAEPAYRREPAFYYEATEAPASAVPAHTTPIPATPIAPIAATVQRSDGSTAKVEAELTPAPAPAPAKRAKAGTGSGSRSRAKKAAAAAAAPPPPPPPPPPPVPAPAPKPAAASSGPAPSGPSGGNRRRGRKAEPDRPLRKVEKDHIDWISNLVNVPADPELKMTKER